MWTAETAWGARNPDVSSANSDEEIGMRQQRQSGKRIMNHFAEVSTRRPADHPIQCRTARYNNQAFMIETARSPIDKSSKSIVYDKNDDRAAAQRICTARILTFGKRRYRFALKTPAPIVK